MDETDYVDAILGGEICPETADWLQRVFQVAIMFDMPLERVMGIRGGLQSWFYMALRDEAIDVGMELAGSAEALVELYGRFRIGLRVPEDLEPACERLKWLEDRGCAPPGARGCRRVAQKRREKCRHSEPEVVRLPIKSTA